MKHLKSHATGMINTAKNKFALARTKLVAVGTGIASAASSGMAMAQSSLGSSAVTEVTGVKADVLAVLGVLVGVVFLLVAWAYLKKAK